MLRPLVRLFVRAGVTYPVFADELRRLFVAVAADEIVREEGRATASRLTLATGVHRKEIARLLREGAGADAGGSGRGTSLAAALVAHWLGAAGYQDAAGQPLVLPRIALGETPSFERLVRDVTTDLRPRTVLDDWVARGLATLDPAGERVTLVEAEAIPAADPDGRLFFFTRNLHDHLAAATANVDQGASVFPDASVRYDRLSPGAAAALEAVARRSAARLLRDVNRAALAILAERGAETGEARVHLGVYLFRAAGDADRT